MDISLNRFTMGLPSQKLELLIYPDHILKKTANAVDTYDRALQWLANQMFVFMRANRGIGMAASQVGVLSRIITVDIEGIEKCLVNPEIVSCCLETVTDTEGCLSLPSRLFDVKRYLRIEVRARCPEGKSLHFEASGLAARVLQHEIDHLNGRLICDHGTEIIV
jgi:peptide deformylase